MTVPAGYERAEVRGVEVVARAGLMEAIRTALKAGTLYEYAAQHEEARSLAGRGIAYSVPLPTGDRVVVRHNRHGGLLAPLTGDRFLTPTRAPHELTAALRLAKAGVPTPELVAYAVYRAGPLLRRSDVATREIRDSRDLAAVLTGDDPAERRAGLDAAAALIGALSAAGARHHDLNIKNVLLARTGGNSRSSGAFRAYVLDVDRMEFGRPGDSRITENNLDRFARSVRKWRDLYGARVDEGDLARVAASVRRVVSTPPSPRRPASVRS
jgi:3-deoxy-D-manno-octulosonic acid kinase